MEVIDRLETYAEATANRPFRGLRSEFVAGLESDDPTVVDEVLGFVRSLAALVVESLDQREIAALSAQIRRLDLLAVKSGAALASDASTRLAVLSEVLDVAGAAARVRAVKAGQRQQSQLLADRVRRSLAGQAQRTKAIAEACGCDPAQVSRILRELVADGSVVLVDPPEGESDRRARWYVAVAGRAADLPAAA